MDTPDCIKLEPLPNDIEVEVDIKVDEGSTSKAAESLQQEIRFECNVCGKEVKNLRRHKRTHTDKRRYQCELCGKVVKNIHVHMLNHKDIERRFECEFCDKKFTKKSHIDRHREIHTGNRPHKCGMCGLAFITNSDLAQHERIHTRERAHPCDICGRDFIRISDLRHHRRIHTGERPYSCTVCGEDFYRNNHLKRHQKKHERLEPPAKRGRKKRDISEYMSKEAYELYKLANQLSNNEACLPAQANV